MKFTLSFLTLSVILSLLFYGILGKPVLLLSQMIYWLILAFIFIISYWMNLNVYLDNHVNAPKAAGVNFKEFKIKYYINNEKDNLICLVFILFGQILSMLIFPLSIITPIMSILGIAYICYKMIGLNFDNVNF